MMIFVRKSKTLGMRRLTHTWKKGSPSLFRLAQRWNGSESEEGTGSQYNIIPIVLGSTKNTPMQGVLGLVVELSQPLLWACDQGKEVARVRAKRKPGSHIRDSWECRRV